MLGAAYPITVLCRVLDLPRSTQYYQSIGRDEAELRQALEAAAQEFPTYGSRRLTQQVRRLPYRLVAGRTRVRRLMGELGLKRRPKRRICHTTNSQHGYLDNVRFHVGSRSQSCAFNRLRVERERSTRCLTTKRRACSGDNCCTGIIACSNSRTFATDSAGRL